jgi:hypothetical protein
MTSTPRRAAFSLAMSFLALGGLATSAGAQHFNIDFDDPFAAFGSPGPGYAAAGTAGTWNSIDASFGGLHALVDKTGAASSVTFDCGPQMVFPFSFANANYGGGDHGALLQDLVWSAGAMGGTMKFDGLVDGNYTLLCYATAPDSKAGGITDVDSPQSADGVQSVGGALWTGVHVQGETYSKHNVTVVGGVLEVSFLMIVFADSCNGIQLEPAEVNNSGASDCDCVAGGPCFTVSGAGHGCPNSNASGLGAKLSGAGNASMGADSFSLAVTDAAPSKPGLILSGTASLGPGGVATVPDSAGLLCVGGSTRRGSVVVTDATGAASFPDFQGAAYSASDIVSVGSSVSYTHWFRDPGTTAGCPNDTASSDFNFSNGWTVTWQ